MTYYSYITEGFHTDGTYASVIPSAECKEKIYAFCASLGIENLMDSKYYHCTVICSEKSCPEILNESFGLPIEATMKGFKVLGEDSKVLVLELFCPEVKQLHDTFRKKYGAAHSFDSFIPHITIAKDFEGELPNGIYEDIIEFTGIKVEELS
jgi:hypothetical protein